MDPGAEQAFRGIDVSHADHHLRVHDCHLDRDRLVLKRSTQTLRGELLPQRLWAKVFQQRMRIQLLNGTNQRQPEAARIVVTQLHPARHRDADVVVLFPILPRRDHPQTARHAEMDDHRLPAIRFQHQILGPPPHRRELCTLQARQLRRNRLPQIVAPNDHLGDPPPHHMRRNSPTRRLHFRQLRHGGNSKFPVCGSTQTSTRRLDKSKA